MLLCAHGGGYVIGSMYTHRKLYGHLAKAVGCRALIVHYRPAPEHVHPGPVNDIAQAYRWLLDQGIKPEHIALTGDSAGGGLAITTLLRAREQGLPMPAATMPLSPWLDMDAAARASKPTRRTTCWSRARCIEEMASTFLGEDGNRHDPLATRCTATCGGCRRCISRSAAMRPCWMTAALAEAAARRRVNVKLDVFPEMQHVFHFLAGVAPEADDAIGRSAGCARSWASGR